jgi:hypothetical protein
MVQTIHHVVEPAEGRSVLGAGPVKVTTICPNCGSTNVVTVDWGAYGRWQRHEELIQDAFPELTPAQREGLLTGYCDPCFDDMWADDSDNDNESLDVEELTNELIALGFVPVEFPSAEAMMVREAPINDALQRHKQSNRINLDMRGGDTLLGAMFGGPPEPDK